MLMYFIHAIPDFDMRVPAGNAVFIFRAGRRWCRGCHGGFGLSFTGLNVAPGVFLPAASGFAVLAVSCSTACKSFAFASAAEVPVGLLLTAIFAGAFSGGDFLTRNWFACCAEPTTQKTPRITAIANESFNLEISNPLLQYFKLLTIRCTHPAIPLMLLRYVKPRAQGKHSGKDKEGEWVNSEIDLASIPPPFGGSAMCAMSCIGLPLGTQPGPGYNLPEM